MMVEKKSAMRSKSGLPDTANTMDSDDETVIDMDTPKMCFNGLANRDSPHLLHVPTTSDRCIRRAVSELEPICSSPVGIELLRRTESDFGQSLTGSFPNIRGNHEGAIMEAIDYNVDEISPQRSILNNSNAPGISVGRPNRQTGFGNRRNLLPARSVPINNVVRASTFREIGFQDRLVGALNRRASDIGIIPIRGARDLSPYKDYLDEGRVSLDSGQPNHETFRDNSSAGLSIAELTVSNDQAVHNVALYAGNLAIMDYHGGDQFRFNDQRPVNASPADIEGQARYNSQGLIVRHSGQNLIASAPIYRGNPIQHPPCEETTHTTDGRRRKPFQRGLEAFMMATIEKWNVTLFSINPKLAIVNENTRFYVIKSTNELDVFSSLKWGIWTSTDLGNKRLDKGFKMQYGIGPVLLFYSVNGSGKFCGVAEMTSRVDKNARAGIWSEPRWRGRFNVKWLFVKDIPMSQLRYIRVENNDNLSVSCSRDTQELYPNAGFQLLHVFNSFTSPSGMLHDPCRGFITGASNPFILEHCPRTFEDAPYPGPLSNNMAPAGFPIKSSNAADNCFIDRGGQNDLYPRPFLNNMDGFSMKDPRPVEAYSTNHGGQQNLYPPLFPKKMEGAARFSPKGTETTTYGKYLAGEYGQNYSRPCHSMDGLAGLLSVKGEAPHGNSANFHQVAASVEAQYDYRNRGCYPLPQAGFRPVPCSGSMSGHVNGPNPWFPDDQKCEQDYNPPRGQYKPHGGDIDYRSVKGDIDPRFGSIDHRPKGTGVNSLLGLNNYNSTRFNFNSGPGLVDCGPAEVDAGSRFGTTNCRPDHLGYKYTGGDVSSRSNLAVGGSTDSMAGDKSYTCNPLKAPTIPRGFESVFAQTFDFNHVVVPPPPSPPFGQ